MKTLKAYKKEQLENKIGIMSLVLWWVMLIIIMIVF